MNAATHTLAGGRERLESLWSRGKTFLGTELAILGGAMSWVSERHLVSAISNAGGFGVLASGSMSPDMLRAEIQATQALTDKPFGVNLILMHPQIMQMIAVCGEEQVTHVVLAGNLPKQSVVDAVHATGAKVMCFAPALSMARRLVKMGVDAIVIEGMEAGGHIGPVSLSVLAQEILPNIQEVPVFVAGGLARGEAMVGYLEMGAAGCQMGTRFVCAEESIAHAQFKQAFIRASARDAVISSQLYDDFPVIPVRALANEGTKAFNAHQHAVAEKYRTGELDKEAAQLEIEHFWAGALRRAVIEGDVTNGSVMAGQSVGMVTKIQPVQEILDEVVEQAVAFLARH